MAAAGHRVVAVEPNDEMRAAAAADSSNITWLAGAAEQLPLPSAQFDLWTAAQAFHWFDPERAGAEAWRVLRSAGAVALLWNHLDVDDAPAHALRRLLFTH